MACLGADRPADMHQSPPICPTDAPGASTGQCAGGWPPSGRCGSQARRSPGPEAGLWGSQTSLDPAHPPTSRFGMTIERTPAYGQSRPRVRKARRIQCAQGEEARKPRIPAETRHPASIPGGALERAIDAPSLGRRCVWPGGCTGPSRRISPVHCASGALTASIAGAQSPAGPS